MSEVRRLYLRERTLSVPRVNLRVFPLADFVGRFLAYILSNVARPYRENLQGISGEVPERCPFFDALVFFE